ncbi:MAG: hypothetical protein WAT39_23900 [Planctomycetota bacterium]
MEAWGIAANFVGPRVFRWGAKVQVVLQTGGDPARVKVVGLNFHGRTVECYVALRHLRSFRPVWLGEVPASHVGWLVYATKAEAAECAASFDRACAFWTKCPMVTWREHQAMVRAGAGK